MKPNYLIEDEDSERILLLDLGPWDHHKTITNGVETVVREMREKLSGRRLFYIDSEGSESEILIDEQGNFVNFA